MPNNKTPRTAAEAEATARRFERAKMLLSEGYTFTKDPDSDVVAVKKPGTHTAADYWLNMLTPGCDCADAMKGNYCKHEMCWDGIQAEQAEELEGLEAQCAEYDALHGPDMPPADTTRALMLAEYRKAERNLAANPEPFSTKAEASRQRMRDTEAALKMYDEVTTKQAIDFYKRGLDKVSA